MKRPARNTLLFAALILSLPLLCALCMVRGAVDIPPADIAATLFGGGSGNEITEMIVWEARVPMTCAALFTGMALAAAGLLMQTVFRNPLAGPSVLGVSSGASLGVAVVMLSAATSFLGADALADSRALASMTGAFIGATLTVALLVALSAAVKNGVMLLIVGIMLSYLSSAVISLLNFFSPAEDVKAFMVWGLGSFGAMTLADLPWLACGSTLLLTATLAMAKPLNALLLGERYAETMGYNVRQLRNILLLVSGMLTAITTAFCGPIGFLGLAVPHMARMTFRTSNHNVLLPASILTGGAVSLLCLFLSLIPASRGVLPINAVTPVIGVPVILYVIINRRKLNYFN